MWMFSEVQMVVYEKLFGIIEKRRYDYFLHGQPCLGFASDCFIADLETSAIHGLASIASYDMAP